MRVGENVVSTVENSTNTSPLGKILINLAYLFIKINLLTQRHH